MKEQRDSVPPVVRIVGGLFSELLDHQTGIGKGGRVGIERPMDAVVGHRQAIPRTNIGVVPGLGIRIADDKGRVRGHCPVEVSCGVEWVHDRHHELAVDGENSTDFGHRVGDDVDVVQAHERNDAIGGSIWQRQIDGIRDYGWHRRRCVCCGGLHHGERAIERKNTVSLCLQLAANPAFASADVYGEAAGRRDQWHEGQLVAAVAVQPSSGPLDPGLGVGIPAISQE